MILVKPSFEIIEIMSLSCCDRSPLQLIEEAGRTCYKSESAIDSSSAEKFAQSRLKDGHESVLEHSALTVRFICDRGVTHELVRHRLCAFSQESTRYCNYSGGVTFIIPPWIDIEEGEYKDSFGDVERYWMSSLLISEGNYINLLSCGWSPQQARSVLPNSLKTEIVMTANFREWRHIFKLRCDKTAHPQMREIMIPLLNKCKQLIPIIFDDIMEKE